MTKQITNLFLACSATCIMGIALHAESYLCKATVPFAFQVDGKNVGSAKTDGSGNAVRTYKIAKGTLAGAHTITVTHKASRYYRASAGIGTLTVN